MYIQGKRFIAAVGAVAMVFSLTACAKKHTHDYSQMGSNKTHHWKYCPEDNEKDTSSLEKHTDANSDGKCDVCGYDVGVPHVHDYCAWGSDAENHWKYCPEDNEKDSTSVAPHVDADEDGKCDVCGQDSKAPEAASVTIDTMGVPTLIVKGPITQACGYVKLHGEANGANLYWDNVSKFANAYEFQVPLSDLPVDGTPWVWFHIYAYESSAPANKDNFTEKFDLDRGSELTVGQYIDYDGIRYTVIGNGDSTQLVIQPTEISDMKVESIKMEVVNGKPMVIVKGTMPSDAACIKLHADGNGKHYYGDNVSKQSGKFELHFDLSQVPVDDTPWLWFHIYTYDVAAPADPQENFKKLDLERGSWIKVGDKITCDGIAYTVQDQGQLVIQPKAEPKLSIESIRVDVSGKPVLIVKGTMPSDVACIKLHADAAGEHYYGDNVSKEANKFELRFDLTQLRKDGEWAWFHIWTYGDKNPSDLSAPKRKMDLLRGELLTGEIACDYENVHYELVSEGNYYGMVVFYAYQEQIEKPEEKTDISVSLDNSTGVPTLVVKGTMPENAGCLKLHGEANGADLYWDNVSKNSATFEFRAPLSDLPLKDTPWVWFHVYAYAEATPSDKGAYAVKTNLPRGDGINVGQYVEYNDVRYSVIGSGDSTQLVIQPTEAPKMKVESIKMELVSGKPVLIVKGTMPSDVACIKLHADAAGEHYYGDNVSKEANKFELRFDLTQLRKDGEWAWFHIWTYGDKNPADLSAPKEKMDLLRGDLIGGEVSCDYENVHYELVNNGNYYGLVVFCAKQEQTVEPEKPADKLEVTQVTLDISTGVPTLVVKGTMSETILTVKLHGSANGQNLYWDNASQEAGAFELRMALNELPLQDTPWVFFHVYGYKEAEPTDQESAALKNNLERGEAFQPGLHMDYEGVRYTVIGDGDSTQLIIQPTEAPKMKVESIKMEVIDEKPILVVKGTMPSDVACIKLHAEGNGKHYFGDNVSTEANKFELHFDLSQVPVDDTPWLWFHIYTYAEAEPADPQANAKSMDLSRSELINVGDKLEYDGIVYTVLDNGQLVIHPTIAPEKPADKLEVTQVTLDINTGVPTLVVKGTMSETILTVKLHGSANGQNLYWDNASQEAGAFELRMALNELPLQDTPWVFFHVYGYKEAEPTDLESAALKNNLERGEAFQPGLHMDYEGVRYTVIGDGDSSQLIIQPTEAPKESKLEITGVSIDQNTGLLIVTGNVSSDITDIKISADTKKDGVEIELLGEQAVIQDGTFEASFDLTQLPANNEWAFFHVCYGDNKSVNLPREGYLPESGSVVYQDVKYEIIKQDWDQLILRASEDTEE